MPGLRIRWLGTFGYEISDENATILIDPFLSRPKTTDLFKTLFIDTSAVDKYLISSIDLSSIEAILITHSHYDHLQDVPYVLSKYGDPTQRPIVIGDPNMSKIIKGYDNNVGIDWSDRIDGLLDTRLKVLDFESDISIINIGKFGLFNITAFQNQHPNYDYIPWRGPQGQINDKPPYHSWDYKTYNDMSIGYIIEYNGLRICFADSPLIKNPSVIGDVDILIQSIAVRAYNNISKCLEELRPTYYIPAHYDDFFQPFKTIDRPDTLIGAELSFRKSKKSSNTSSLLNYTRYDEFFSEFNDQYIPEAMTSKKLIIEPKLRLLKPMYYYSIESLIVK